MTANCYRQSNVAYMLMLHSKCCINVLIASRSNTWSGNIWNIPNLLSAGKWWVPSTRAYNVLKMFLLVSRPPCPQWVVNVHFKMSKTFLTLLTQSTLAISLGRHSPLSTPVNFQTSTHHHGWQEYCIWFWDPHKIIHAILANKDLDGKIDYSPHQIFVDRKWKYSNLMSGDWAWRQAIGGKHKICQSSLTT